MSDRRKSGGKKPQGGTSSEPSGKDESKSEWAELQAQMQAMEARNDACVTELNARAETMAARLDAVQQAADARQQKQDEQFAAMKDRADEQFAAMKDRAEEQAKVLQQIAAMLTRTPPSVTHGEAESKADSTEDADTVDTPTGPGGALNFTPAPGLTRRRDTTFRPVRQSNVTARPSTSSSIREADSRVVVEKAKKSFTITLAGDSTDVMSPPEWLDKVETKLLGQWHLTEEQAVDVATSLLRGRVLSRVISNDLFQGQHSWEVFKETVLSFDGIMGTKTEVKRQMFMPQTREESFDQLVCRHARGHKRLRLRFGEVYDEEQRMNLLLDCMYDRKLAQNLIERGFKSGGKMLAYVRTALQGALAMQAELADAAPDASSQVDAAPRTPGWQWVGGARPASEAPMPSRKPVVAALKKVAWAGLDTPRQSASEEILDLARQAKEDRACLLKAIEAMQRTGQPGSRDTGSRAGSGRTAWNQRPSSPSGRCFGCGQPGHFIRNCPTNDELRKATSIRAGDPTTRWVTR